MSDNGPAVDLADGLACKLTDLGFASTRSHYPIIRTDDVESLKIYVIPGGNKAEIRTRTTNAHDVVAAIMVAKNLKDPEDASEFDGVAQTVEAIKLLWENPGLGGTAGTLRRELIAGLAWKGNISNEPLFDQTRLYEHNQLVSIIQLTYHGTR
ncbi:hypothetical protein AB1K70_26625 [Bremerella sp. JC770]|uniref:hypothetical protein n=1 Tax=Bremerella sp. JC770 TaxID=3232137 RepID=UPI003457B25A